MTSAVDWLISKFRTNFARNSNFHIRMTILCQLRDSVTPALRKSARSECALMHQIILFHVVCMYVCV